MVEGSGGPTAPSPSLGNAEPTRSDPEHPGRPPLPRGRPVTHADVDALIAALRRELPGFAVRFKDESRLQRALGWLLRPINRRYLTHFTTVMGGQVWFPSRAAFRATDPAAIYVTLCHEAVHLHDARRFPLLFELSYVLLLPVGVTARSYWEFRAYRESMRVWLALHGSVSDPMIEVLVAHFTGPEYFYMCPFPVWIRARLCAARDRMAAQLR